MGPVLTNMQCSASKICFPSFQNVHTKDDEATCDITYICYEADPVQEDMQLVQ